MVGGAENDIEGCWSQRASPRRLESQPQSGDPMPVDHKPYTRHQLLPQGVECLGHGDSRVSGDRWEQTSWDMLMWDPVITRGVEMLEEPRLRPLDPLCFELTA